MVCRVIYFDKYVHKLFTSCCFLWMAHAIFLKDTSCYAQNPTGGVASTKYYYPSGALLSEGFLINGKPDGYWKTYNENGSIKSEGLRKNFLLDSTWVFYDAQGKRLYEYVYREGKKNGIKKTYNHEKEGVASEEIYENDVKQGMSQYYRDEKKIKEIPFVKGKEEGIAREFDKEGQIITITQYKNGFVVSEEKINRYDKFGNKQGLWKTFYPNGSIHTECRYLDNKEDGYFKEFGLDGNILKTEKYDMGILKKNVAELVKLDVRNEYYENGKLKSSGTFKDGYAEGITRYYSEEGKIVNSKIFKDGELFGEGIYDEKGYQQGRWKEYYASGELKGEGEYIDGRRIGDWIFYHQNGKIEQKGKFLKGAKPSGLWVWFYESGNMLRQENFTNGLENGMLIEYNDSGRVTTKGEFVDGEKEGPWILEDGDIVEQGVYKNGQKDGIWKTYSKRQVLLFQGNFIDGNPDGKHVFYYENGKLRAEGKYTVGQKQDTWRYFNEEGELETTLYFKNDEEQKIDGLKIDNANDK